MFAYCGNNSLVFFDPFGCDAVILFDSSSVGHIGLLVQDGDGKWHHYYWGSVYAGKSSSFKCSLGINTKAKEKICNYNGAISIVAINSEHFFGGSYEKSIYLKGDFSDAFTYIDMHSDESYNLFNNNCSQHSINALAYCDTVYKDILKNAAQDTLPASAYWDIYWSVLPPLHGGSRSVRPIIRYEVM